MIVGVAQSSLFAGILCRVATADNSRAFQRTDDGSRAAVHASRSDDRTVVLTRPLPIDATPARVVMGRRYATRKMRGAVSRTVR